MGRNSFVDSLRVDEDTLERLDAVSRQAAISHDNTPVKGEQVQELAHTAQFTRDGEVIIATGIEEGEPATASGIDASSNPGVIGGIDAGSETGVNGGIDAGGETGVIGEIDAGGEMGVIGGIDADAGEGMSM